MSPFNIIDVSGIAANIATCLVIIFKYDALIVNLRNNGLQEGLRAKDQMQKLIE